MRHDRAVAIGGAGRGATPRMRVFIAGLETETNTFSPLPTGMDNFSQCLLARGGATRAPTTSCASQMATWRALAEARGWTVIESLCAVAEPAGVTTRPTYEMLRGYILEDLDRAGQVDIILFAFHGAMVADGYPDAEGDLLAHVRALTGPSVAIGVELDLHCHLTDLMVECATAIILYKEYPHTDIIDRAVELFAITAGAAEGTTTPVMALFDCHMLGLFRTQDESVRAIVDEMIDMERRPQILSLSFCHGFPWGDVPEAGAKTLAIVDNDKARATAAATELGLKIYRQRQALENKPLALSCAIQAALASPLSPIVLADVSDNAGGGAPSDSTFILRRLLEMNVGHVLCAFHWDPVAVQICQQAGEGARLSLRVGGKVGPQSGDPLDLDVIVRKLISGAAQPFGAVDLALGDLALVSVNGIDLILNTVRTQVFSPRPMQELGLDLAAYKMIIVKSTNHFQAGFKDIARETILVDAGGTMPQDFTKIPYVALTRKMWPIHADPLGID